MLAIGTRIRFTRDVTDVIDEENPGEYALLAGEGEEGEVIGISDVYYLVRADITGAEFAASVSDIRAALEPQYGEPWKWDDRMNAMLNAERETVFCTVMYEEVHPDEKTAARIKDCVNFCRHLTDAQIAAG